MRHGTKIWALLSGLTALSLGAACSGGDGAAGDPVALCGADRLVVTTADFASGTGGRLLFDPATGSVTPLAGDTADVDSVPAMMGCTPVLLERTLGLVHIMSAESPLEVVRTIDANPAGSAPGSMFLSNPQRVVQVDENRAYVVALSLNEVLIVDPTAEGDAARVGSIDLSPFMLPGDQDGLVDAMDAVRVDDRVYVALGRSFYDADAFALQFEGSAIAVIDTTTDTLVDMNPDVDGVQPIELEGDNPFGGMAVDRDAGRLIVANTGQYGVEDGGLEAVDLALGESAGMILTEASAGADMSSFTLVAPTRAYFHENPVYNDDFEVVTPGRIRGFDPSTGDMDEGVMASEVDGMILHGGTLFAWSGALLRSFDAASGLETTPESGPHDLGSIPIFAAAPAP